MCKSCGQQSSGTLDSRQMMRQPDLLYLRLHLHLQRIQFKCNNMVLFCSVNLMIPVMYCEHKTSSGV